MNTINVLYFSYLSRSKGVLTAFQAAEEVVKEKPFVNFAFAGPFESAFIEEKFNQLRRKYPSNICYCGYIENVEERTSLFRQSDIFIFPSHRDVFGLVLLHAMAESLPIVASIEGAIPEIIEEEENGYLVEKEDYRALAEKIIILALDDTRREKMGLANRKKYLERYTPQKYLQRMKKVMEEIIALDKPAQMSC